MYLHEAIATVLREADGREATSTAIANVINSRRLYVRQSDGQPVRASQVAARVRRSTYSDLFITSGSLIRLR